jgi:hypothetical protein
VKPIGAENTTPLSEFPSKNACHDKKNLAIVFSLKLAADADFSTISTGSSKS